MNQEQKENKSRVIILVGRSGSGKGTQGQFIKNFLEKNFPENEMHYLSTGEEMRRIMKQSSYTAQLSRNAVNEGKLQPVFFSVYVWAKYLMEHIHGNDNIIFDGVPRRKEEAKTLHSAVKFYDWEKPIVINLDVSEEECIRTRKQGSYYVILPMLQELNSNKKQYDALQKEFSSKDNVMDIYETVKLLSDNNLTIENVLSRNELLV